MNGDLTCKWGDLWKDKRDQVSKNWWEHTQGDSGEDAPLSAEETSSIPDPIHEKSDTWHALVKLLELFRTKRTPCKPLKKKSKLLVSWNQNRIYIRLLTWKLDGNETKSTENTQESCDHPRFSYVKEREWPKGIYPFRVFHHIYHLTKIFERESEPTAKEQTQEKDKMVKKPS